jgi:hypothetical protein
MNYRGRVHNGVIVLETPVRLAEGTPVRVETLAEPPLGDEQDARAERCRRLLQRLQEWDTENAAEDERLGNMLREELAADDDGMRFRDDGDLEKILREP